MDEFAVGGCLHSDGPADSRVEVGDFLTKAGFDVGAADVSSDAVGGGCEENTVSVTSDESRESDDEKV